MPLPHAEWTAERARALPDDAKRYEVLDGELFVSPAPSWDHQAVVKELLLRLEGYLRGANIGWAMISPADIELSQRRLVQPDVFVVPFAERRPREWKEVKTLLVAAEVLSRTTARADRLTKRVIYQDQRIPEYWIVDPEARLVERWRPHDERPEVQADTLTWLPRDDVAPLTIQLAEFFASALD